MKMLYSKTFYLKLLNYQDRKYFSSPKLVCKKIQLKVQQLQVNIANEEEEKIEEVELSLEEEIVKYLDSKKLKLVNPDQEFYMRMPEY